MYLLCCSLKTDSCLLVGRKYGFLMVGVFSHIIQLGTICIVVALLSMGVFLYSNSALA